MSVPLSQPDADSSTNPQWAHLYVVSSQTQTGEPAAMPAPVARPFGWILHPAIDLLFCCGGLVWLLFAFHYFYVLPAKNEVFIGLLSLVVILATHILSETHTSATLLRAYKDEETRNRYSLYTRWGAFLCVVLLAAGLLVKGFTPIMAR